VQMATITVGGRLGPQALAQRERLLSCHIKGLGTNSFADMLAIAQGSLLAVATGAPGVVSFGQSQCLGHLWALEKWLGHRSLF
jgi:hypothetical protein